MNSSSKVVTLGKDSLIVYSSSSFSSPLLSTPSSLPSPSSTQVLTTFGRTIRAYDASLTCAPPFLPPCPAEPDPNGPFPYGPPPSPTNDFASYTPPPPPIV